MSVGSRLSKFQHDLIDALPFEGAAAYGPAGQRQTYSEAQIQELALLPLQGKEASSEKTAIILHGAPGAGKSFAGWQRLEREVADDPSRVKSLAVISYDEHGAIYDIPEYIERIKSFGAAGYDVSEEPFSHEGYRTLAERTAAWQEFQPLSQLIRSHTLKHALRDELSLFVDITASGPGALKFIETLRDLDYTDIQVWSYHSQFRLAQERIENRTRPTSAEDLYYKRVGALATLPQLVAAADHLEMIYNSSNVLEPMTYATFRAGQYMSGLPDVAASVAAQLEHDVFEIEHGARARFGYQAAAQLMKSYDAARKGVTDVLRPATQSFMPRYDMD